MWRREHASGRATGHADKAKPDIRTQDTQPDVGRTSELRRWLDVDRPRRHAGASAENKKSASLTVGDIMSKPVRAVAPDTLLQDVAALMRAENVGAVPVLHDDGRLAGMITDRDIVVRGCARAVPLAELGAADVMSERVAAAHERDSIHRALELMAHGHVRRLPVVDNHDRVVGVVSIADVAAHAQDDHELQDAFLRMSGHRSFWHLP